MSGITFDGWKTQLYEDYLAHSQGGLIVGTDCLAIDQDSLMHFRTKGSKNGVRRYQMPDGTWTPLGLRERRVREGFGERREARREARAQRRSERKAAKAAERSARAERMAKFKAERAEAKRKRNVKNLTDEELEKGINRLKMEQEYRDLTRSPVIKTAESLVKSYFDSKARREEADNKRRQLANQERQSLAQLIKAKADLRNANNARIDSLMGTARKKASADFQKAKNERSKNTVRGAISSAVGNIIRKEGNRTVQEMSANGSLAMRGGRFVKQTFKRGGSALNSQWRKFRNNQLYGQNMNRGSGPNLN